jgi:hypothetical protein
MEFCVFGSAKDLQIFWTVICFYAVFVVNHFGGKEGSSQYLFHDVSVPSDEFTFFAKSEITFVVGSSTLPAWIVCSRILSSSGFFNSAAFNRATKVRDSFQPPAGSIELFTATRTQDRFSSFVTHVFNDVTMMAEQSIIGVS